MIPGQEELIAFRVTSHMTLLNMLAMSGMSRTEWIETCFQITGSYVIQLRQTLGYFASEGLKLRM